MKISVLYLTGGGAKLADRIAASLENAHALNCRGNLMNLVQRAWTESDAIIFIMAAGIVVRGIAPLLSDKHSDPAVVVCDERGRFAISLLSGHIGGANELAERVASITGGKAVITTASDVLGRTALDLWAAELGLVASDRSAMTRAMGRLVNQGSIKIYSEVPLPKLPSDIRAVQSPESADIIVSFRTAGEIAQYKACPLHPPVLSAGIGCNRGTSASQISDALSEACRVNGLALQSVARIATIDLKRDEEGLIELASSAGLPLLFFSKDQLNRVEGCSFSHAAMKATGARGVAEPAAILASLNGKLIVRKMKWKDVTVALALDSSPWWEQGLEPGTS